MKHICKHCQNYCKKGMVENCINYNPKAKRPEQLKTEIRNAFKSGDYELGKKLQEELTNFNI